MRIAMMTNNYIPFIGGVPISVKRLADGLRENGHTVYIFAPDYKDNGEDDNFTIRYPTTKNILAGAIPLPKRFDSSFKKHFNNLDIDIIHVHHPVLIGKVALRLGKKNHIPVVFTYHTRYEQYLHYFKPYEYLESKAQAQHKVAQKIVETVQQEIVPAYINWFMSRCDLVFAPTKTIQEHLLQKAIPVPAAVLPTGLPKGSFEFSSNADELRKEYAQGRKYLFCSVSRLAKEKNLPFLLRGLSILKERMGDCFRLLLIGDGPEKSNLQAEACRLGLHENIVFVGSVPNNEIPCFHQASNLFLFASTSETQGIVLLEAMAAGTPVVAVKASGVQDVLVHGHNGMMSGKDPSEWAEMIFTVLKEDSLRRKLQMEAKQTALQYSNKSVAQAAISNYQKVLVKQKVKCWPKEKLESSVL